MIEHIELFYFKNLRYLTKYFLKFIFMIFSLITLTLSHQVFNVTSNSFKSLILYINPRHSIEVNVSSELQTYFSDLLKANGLTLEIQTNNGTKFGPFNHRSHLDGINFHPNNISYKLSFTNEGNDDIQLAMVFAEDLDLSLNTIDQNMKNFKFPISNYPSKKYTYFNSAGLIFHEKKYSIIYFIVVPVVIAAIFIVIFIIGIPAVFAKCAKREKVSNL